VKAANCVRLGAAAWLTNLDSDFAVGYRPLCHDSNPASAITHQRSAPAGVRSAARRDAAWHAVDLPGKFPVPADKFPAQAKKFPVFVGTGKPAASG
jgi:hypothetical protein